MDITSVASGAVAPACSSASIATASPETDAVTATTKSSISDSVTVSSAAQQAAQQAKTATSVWSGENVTQALAALNDTSGKTSLSDQLSAYKTLAGLISDTKNFDPSNAQNADAVNVATAFSTTAYVEHFQSMMAQFMAFNNISNEDHWGKDQSDIQQRQLNYFNALSDNDQQMLVQTRDASGAAIGTEAYFGSVEQFKTRQQARIDLSRAMEALVAKPAYAAEIAAKKNIIDNSSSDAITATLDVIAQKAQADGDTQGQELIALGRGRGYTNFTASIQDYFAKYGPAPQQSAAEKTADAAAPLPPSSYKAATAGQMSAFFEDIETLSDSRGISSATDLTSAYKNVSKQTAASISTDNGGVAWIAGLTAGEKSVGSKLIYHVQQAYSDATWANRGSSGVSSAQSAFRTYEHLSYYDQQIIGSLYSNLPGTDDMDIADRCRKSLIDDISNGAQGDAITALYNATAHGHLTAKSTVTILGVTLNLNDIMASNDMRLDPYTRMSPKVKAILYEAAQKWAAGEKVSIDATKLNDSAPQTDAEKALAALKAYRAGTNTDQTDDEKALAALKKTNTSSAESVALATLKATKSAGTDKSPTADRSMASNTSVTG